MKKNTQTSANFVAHFPHGGKTESRDVHSFPQLTESVSLSYITREKILKQAVYIFDEQTHHQEHTSGINNPFTGTRVQHMSAFDSQFVHRYLRHWPLWINMLLALALA